MSLGIYRNTKPTFLGQDYTWYEVIGKAFDFELVDRELQCEILLDEKWQDTDWQFEVTFKAYEYGETTNGPPPSFIWFRDWKPIQIIASL